MGLPLQYINRELRQQVGDAQFWLRPWRQRLAEAEGTPKERYVCPKWYQVPEFQPRATTIKNTDVYKYLVHEFNALKDAASESKDRLSAMRWTFKQRGEYNYLMKMEHIRTPLKDVTEFLTQISRKIISNWSQLHPNLVDECLHLIRKSRMATYYVEDELKNFKAKWDAEAKNRKPVIPRLYRPIRVKPKLPELTTRSTIDESTREQKVDDLRRTANETYERYKFEYKHLVTSFTNMIQRLQPETCVRDALHIQAIQRLYKKLDKALLNVSNDTFSTIPGSLLSMDRIKLITLLADLENCCTIVHTYQMERNRMFLGVTKMLVRQKRQDVTPFLESAKARLWTTIKLSQTDIESPSNQ